MDGWGMHGARRGGPFRFKRNGEFLSRTLRWVICSIYRLLLIVLLVVPAPGVAEDEAIARIFSERGVDGTMVLSSLRSSRTFVHNDFRAGRRFSVASTFKIFNTLIALEEHAIAGADEVLRWDGRRYDFPDWNRDQTLESAFRVSCVWCFQQLARRVGAQKYRQYVRQAVYGELREPFEETTFWLDGSLQISAVEQLEFLKKLYRRELPFSASSYDVLARVMEVDSGPHFAMRAKTGWATRMTPQIGWYVGYVETTEDVWFFAMNLDIRDERDLPLRQRLTGEALQAKGVL